MIHPEALGDKAHAPDGGSHQQHQIGVHGDSSLNRPVTSYPIQDTCLATLLSLERLLFCHHGEQGDQQQITPQDPDYPKVLLDRDHRRLAQTQGATPTIEEATGIIERADNQQKQPQLDAVGRMRKDLRHRMGVREGQQTTGGKDDETALAPPRHPPAADGAPAPYSGRDGK